MNIRFLPLLLFPLFGIAQTNANGEMPLGGNTSSEKQPLEIKRNALFNLEEIKVRWKKAALENCQGVPCLALTAPGAPTGVVATVGNTSVSVAFVAPTNNGGRAITGYTVTTNPATSPVTGTTSPINVTGLTNGAAYTFTVIATNEVGNSVSSSASTAVTAFTCGTSSVPDYDGNAYNTVLIGAQCWMGQNLKVTRYNDGTAIDLDASGGMFGNSSQTWSIKVTGAYTIYENDIINVTRYGFLYNWYAAIDSKKLCPTGWHVPVEDEWKVLGAKLGGPIVAGGKLKSTSTLWINVGVPVPGNNESGFFANPGGFRDAYSGTFSGSGSNAFFWSATGGSGLSASNANGFNLNPGDGYSVPNWRKASGFSVRCLKD